MTAPHARQPEVLPRPACTPTAIRAVLAANAGGDILRRYDEDLDAAFEQAREQGDVTPLVQTVKRWWFEADAWRDPQAQREFLTLADVCQAGEVGGMRRTGGPISGAAIPDMAWVKAARSRSTRWSMTCSRTPARRVG